MTKKSCRYLEFLLLIMFLDLVPFAWKVGFSPFCMKNVLNENMNFMSIFKKLPETLGNGHDAHGECLFRHAKNCQMINGFSPFCM